MIQLCEKAEQHILNGNEYNAPAAFTCHRAAGRSTVDYILSTTAAHVVHYDRDTLGTASDHTLLHFSIPVAVQPPLSSPSTTAATTLTYRWDIGTATADMCDGVARWKDHSASEGFRERMLRVVEDRELGNEARSARMEQFLLEEGERAGVVSVSRQKAPLNPNRWGKFLAPWFDSACHSCKK